jgi:hypothetical protein
MDQALPGYVTFDPELELLVLDFELGQTGLLHQVHHLFDFA